jgi:hypothetical protein
MNQAQPDPPRPASSQITERLNNLMDNTYLFHKNRSADLIPLTAEYEQMKQKLRASVAAMKTYKMKTVALNDAKFEVSVQDRTLVN